MTSSCNCPDFHFEFMNTKNKYWVRLSLEIEKGVISVDEPLLDLHNPSIQIKISLI